ncbi:MAG TPA: CDGSH iron-sulfur domain-containing protein [Candidatus Baltobacteraceae bacterium]|jgi:CDGSH-type Zn-finger protein/truncated hemoglobin YjbI
MPTTASTYRDLLSGVRRLRASLDDGGSDGVAARLDDSVIRPLTALAGSEDDLPQLAHEPAESLWDLAKRAAAWRREGLPPTALLEATAALAQLACAEVSSDANAVAARIAELEALYNGLDAEIRLSHNGPLLVTNVKNLVTWLGEPLSAFPQMALCRCGASAIKPYCDGSHAKIGFDDAKDPKRVPDRQDVYVGQQVTILDNRGTCQHSGYCSDRLSKVFRTKSEPFVAPSGGRMDEIIRAVRDCPSGALSYAVDGVEARADVNWHGRRQPAIEVSKDGPYRVTGPIALRDDQGNDVVRNAGASFEHCALCRCGHAQNKPFCTGMHWYVEFRDPLPPPDRQPSIFEWAGGLPALTRMTRLFYEKFVPADDLLAPLFANMSADHPQRVAKWLGEVFGGPKRYSSEYGGYPRMLSQHLGKCLTEEMRARWVTLLLQSARESGLPNDPEFRSAFQAYIEWGSRLAVENSQTNAQPPQHMPMPHWEWTTSAGPPGSRVSALAPHEEVQVDLPAPGEPVSFAKHVKALFRERDRKSMQFAFDLWAYADVSAHADAILERVKAGTMPCDGAWTPEKVAAFADWIQGGKQE